MPSETQTVPRVVVTDKLRSYGAAHREVMPSVEHRSHKGLNNRAENSHDQAPDNVTTPRSSRPTTGTATLMTVTSRMTMK